MLVTGGAGIMGRRLALALASRGHRTRVLCLPAEADPDKFPAAARLLAEFRNRGIQIVTGDVTLPETLPVAVEGMETVFHLAAILLSPLRPERFHAVNAEGTANLARACEAAGVRHFIHVSSISVLYPWSNAYARSKRLSEDIVRSSRLPFTIIRPSLAYEDGGSAEFMRFVDHLKRGPVVFLPERGRARKRPVHVEDLVEGFLALPGNPKALGKTYAFTGGETVSLEEMARLLLAHMGCPRKPILGFPLWLGFILAGLAWVWARLRGRENVLTVQSLTGLAQDAAPEDGGAASDLGWRPRSFREGIASLRGLENLLAP